MMAGDPHSNGSDTADAPTRIFDGEDAEEIAQLRRALLFFCDQQAASLLTRYGEDEVASPEDVGLLAALAGIVEEAHRTELDHAVE